MMFAQHFLLLLSTLKMRNLLLFSFTLLFVCLSFVYITESINDILKKSSTGRLCRQNHKY